VAQRTLSIGQGWKDGAFFIFELKARYSIGGLRLDSIRPIDIY